MNMLKFLIFLVLLAGPSIFVTDVFSLEVEIQKESERLIESAGWLDLQQYPFHEEIKIVINESTQENRISVGVLSTDINDIRFTKNIESLSYNPKIISFTLTNQYACIPTQIDRACVIIEVNREGLGDTYAEIQKNTREITDSIVANGVILPIVPKFHSVTLEHKTSFDGSEKVFVSQAVYSLNKQPTNQLFTALSTMLVSNDIRTSGGFYDNLEKLSENYFADFTVRFIPIGNSALHTLQVSLTCTGAPRDELVALPRCDPEENIGEQLSRGYISPLDFLQVENINRSTIFEDKFLPLNSIVHVLISSEQDFQVKSVNSNVIKKLEQLGDIQDSGWIFLSKSGKKIDGRFLFGSESSISKNNLAFSLQPYSGSEIEIKENEIIENESKSTGGCLIATAAFGSEMAPQVQFLREIRDNTVLQTESGSAFMTGFNQFYYSFSPAIADYERENPAFKEAVKLTLTPLLTSLTLLQYTDIDSESEMLGYGIGIILLNIGMYFVAPAVLIMKVKKRI